MRTIMIATALVLIATSTHAQVTCQRIGQQTYCSNGSTSQDVGQFRYYNDGTTRQTIGTFDYYSQPTAPAPIYQPPQPVPLYNPRR